MFGKQKETRINFPLLQSSYYYILYVEPWCLKPCSSRLLRNKICLKHKRKQELWCSTRYPVRIFVILKLLAERSRWVFGTKGKTSAGIWLQMRGGYCHLQICLSDHHVCVLDTGSVWTVCQDTIFIYIFKFLRDCFVLTLKKMSFRMNSMTVYGRKY